MRPPLRQTPLDVPRQALHQKHYSATICGDGRILPIEERLGKRLMRTIECETSEARDLLRRGWVLLRTAEGKCLDGAPLDRVFARLREETEARLTERQDDEPWRRHWLTQLESIERWEHALLGRSSDN
jgi:hypothetical protein